MSLTRRFEAGMHQETLQVITDEVARVLRGRFLGRIFQLSSTSLAIDFGSKDAGYLFIGIDPSAPRIHLIKRTSRELEKTSMSAVAIHSGASSQLWRRPTAICYQG